ncbi:MAG: MarR family transcriptional regulator [Acidimicrobiia bacterium]|nr:MarR family transcriptional regulator [Acidimicrobiia bacterium]
MPQTVQSLVEDWERLVPNTDTAALRTGQLLLVSGRALEKTLDDAATAAGFASRGDYEVLALMARREPECLSPVAVAELLGVSPSGMTGKLDRLERDQLLERVRDQVDRRSVKLAITAKGKELVSLGFQAAMGVYTALLSDSEAISQLADTLQEVYENLQLAGPRR